MRVETKASLSKFPTSLLYDLGGSIFQERRSYPLNGRPFILDIAPFSTSNVPSIADASIRAL